MFMTTAPDGVAIHGYDEGSGPVILVIHAGRDDGTAWGAVASRLSSRFRVVRLHRRRYRLDLPSGATCTMADEVGDVLAIAKLVDEPILLVGHSSGAVVALEAMVASPAAFTGAVLYEPPSVIGPPLGGEALRRARAALDAGKPATSLRIFLRDIVRIPAFAARVVQVKATLRPRQLVYVAPQIGDCEAVESLGNRLDVYALITVPVLLFGGDRSPAHFGERLDTLARVLPDAERVAIPRQGHFANQGAPETVADLIDSFAGRTRR